jgi:hypothetical protein
MKRISIIAVLSSLSLFSAVASVGCIGQTTSPGDGTEESTLSSQASNGDSASDPTQSPDFKGKTAQEFQVKIHPTDENGGPSPEPWESQQGPSPEPWNGHAITIASGPGTGGSKP